MVQRGRICLVVLVMKNKNTGTGRQKKHWTIKCEREWHDVKCCVVLHNIGDLGWRQQQPPRGPVKIRECYSYCTYCTVG